MRAELEIFYHETTVKCKEYRETPNEPNLNVPIDFYLLSNFITKSACQHSMDYKKEL